MNFKENIASLSVSRCTFILIGRVDLCVRVECRAFDLGWLY